MEAAEPGAYVNNIQVHPGVVCPGNLLWLAQEAALTAYPATNSATNYMGHYSI